MRTRRLPSTIHARTRHYVGRIAWLPSLLLLLAACGSDATGPNPTVADVAGFYQATALTVTQGGSTTDVLAEGGTLIITLSADGTTIGHLFAPGMDEGGTDFNASLDGSWTLDGNTVHFTQTADSFVRDLPFTADGRTLRADASIQSGVGFQITLSKQTDRAA